jgi:hypothetical protein
MICLEKLTPIRERRGLMNTSIKEKRRDKRYKVAFPIEYTYDDVEVFDNHGTTFDLSTSGMSFYTNKPLREGLNLKVKIPHLWDVARFAVVIWNSLKSPQCFKVGVSFS